MVGDWTAPPDPIPGLPHVAVLLCTYNGAAFLREQINSLAQQTHKNLTLWVSDDGSYDQTRELLESAQRTWGSKRLIIFEGPQKGFARNFLNLACRPEIEADYFAFCDQDDVWLPQKLQRALQCLSFLEPGRAGLYGGTTQLIDSQGQDIGASAEPASKLGFSNALVQNFASGNTMVFNRSLRQHVQQGGCSLEIVSHDWWLYIVATAVGGEVVFDTETQVLYRQHKGNLIGANTRLAARVLRLKAMSTGRLLRWLRINCECLHHLSPSLTSANLQLLLAIEQARRLPRLKRFKLLPKMVLKRKSTVESYLLKIALMLARPTR